MSRAFLDLHAHTRASFDSLASPAAVARAAAARGLTHIAITDHDRIDGALEARDAAPAGLTVIVGEEIRTREGDLIGVFLERPVPPGLPMVEAIAAIREQGGLAGLPHPFDRFRGSLRRDDALFATLPALDWIEGHNARVVGGAGNLRAIELAQEAGVPAVAVSDAHSVMEIGVAYNAVDGDPSTPAGLRAALPTVEMVTGRASYVVRGLLPIAKLVQAWRGNRRVAVEPNRRPGRSTG